MGELMQKMRSGQVVIGPFLKLGDPAVVEIFGLAGFDFVILDAEHGPHSVAALQQLVLAAERRNITPIVRVLENNAGQIQRVLDIGAKGVEVPQINSKAEAQRLVRAVRFAPQGQRGLCRYVRAANYTFTKKEDYFGQANQETMIIAHLEGVEGVRNLDEILEVDIDVLFVGPYDLSQSLGVPGQVDHPLVRSKIQDVCARAAARNVVLGVFADDIDTAQYFAAEGFKYIAYAVDVGILADVSRRIVTDLRRVTN